MLAGQLLGWLRQIPVVCFNPEKYDLNVIKQFFIRYLMKPSEEDDEIDETRFVIKRQNTFMCFSTNMLMFCDMVNYLAPGFRYDKYLKAYGFNCRKVNFRTSTWTMFGNWTTAFYHRRPHSTVGSKMKAYPTKTTLAARWCGTTTGWPWCATFSSGTTTVTLYPSSKTSTNSSPSNNSSISICSKAG